MLIRWELRKLGDEEWIVRFTLVNVYVDLVVFTRIAVLHRPDVVDVGVNTIYKKHAICLKDYRVRSSLSIQYVLGTRIYS